MDSLDFYNNNIIILFYNNINILLMMMMAIAITTTTTLIKLIIIIKQQENFQPDIGSNKLLGCEIIPQLIRSLDEVVEKENFRMILVVSQVLWNLIEHGISALLSQQLADEKSLWFVTGLYLFSSSIALHLHNYFIFTYIEIIISISLDL